jgi:hypothetical protein
MRHRDYFRCRRFFRIKPRLGREASVRGGTPNPPCEPSSRLPRKPRGLAPVGGASDILPTPGMHSCAVTCVDLLAMDDRVIPRAGHTHQPTSVPFDAAEVGEPGSMLA